MKLSLIDSREQISEAIFDLNENVEKVKLKISNSEVIINYKLHPSIDQKVYSSFINFKERTI